MNNANSNEENALCPSCMTANAPSTDFCEKCGCPIGQFVNLDPLKRIYSQGWLYRRSASGRITPIVCLGMWLIFGPSFLISMFVLLETMFDDSDSASHGYWFPLFFGLLSVIILYRVTKNYLRWRGRNTPDHISGERP